MFAGKIQPTNTVRVLALPPAKFPVQVTSVTARVACSHRSSHPSALAPACAERSEADALAGAGGWAAVRVGFGDAETIDCETGRTVYVAG